MKQLLFQVEFEIMTSDYRHVATPLKTVVLALSYDDAARIVKEQYSIYEGFTLGTITPKGIPQLEHVSVAHEDIYFKTQLQ